MASKEIIITAESRYDRQQLIPWWSQETVRNARVLVVGAGALGNEILKLLALTGIGNILIYDMDRIEHSNLSRTVLFRTGDSGRRKATVAAERLGELNSDVEAVGRAENIIHHAGLGIFLWAHVVICGLDNRLARLFVNESCARTKRVWVDGAIEGLSGIVRVFNPSQTSCYECTMNATDHKIVQERRSCALLARDVVSQGHVPTTAIAASIIAALEVQQAVKFLHGQPTLMGEGVLLNGLWDDFERIRYPRRKACQSHGALEKIVPIGNGVANVQLGELLDRAEASFGEGVTLDLSRDVITSLFCPKCQQKTEPCGAVVGAVREADALCPDCNTHRLVNFTGTISRDNDLDLSLTAAKFGIPPFDILTVRKNLEIHEAWLFDADAEMVLGPLADSFRFTQV
ncbi:MAG TPA: ThiF family adenylyltransferase [Pyrinomonadaceae bacterium]